MATGKSKSASLDRAASLAQRLSEACCRSVSCRDSVDSYVVEHGRYGLQVHAALYPDLLTILQREALLAASAQALDIACKGETAKDDRKSSPLTRKDAAAFRREISGGTCTAATLESRNLVGLSIRFADV